MLFRSCELHLMRKKITTFRHQKKILDLVLTYFFARGNTRKCSGNTTTLPTNFATYIIVEILRRYQLIWNNAYF